MRELAVLKHYQHENLLQYIGASNEAASEPGGKPRLQQSLSGFAFFSLVSFFCFPSLCFPLRHLPPSFSSLFRCSLLISLLGLRFSLRLFTSIYFFCLSRLFFLYPFSPFPSLFPLYPFSSLFPFFFPFPPFLPFFFPFFLCLHFSPFLVFPSFRSFLFVFHVPFPFSLSLFLFFPSPLSLFLLCFLQSSPYTVISVDIY